MNFRALRYVFAVLTASVLCALLPGCKENADSAGYSRANAGLPLYQERITPLYWGVIAGKCVARPQPGCERIQQLIASRQYDVISCNYGPANANGTGFQNYVFWHNRVPDDPLSYAIPGDDHPFLMLGKMTVGKCPSTAGGAEPLFQESRLFHKSAFSKSGSTGRYSGIAGSILEFLGPSFLWGFIVHGAVVLASLIYASYKAKSGQWLHVAGLLAGVFTRVFALTMMGVHAAIIAVGVFLTAWPWAVGAAVAIILGKVISVLMWMFGMFRNPPVVVGRVDQRGRAPSPVEPPSPPREDKGRTADW